MAQHGDDRPWMARFVSQSSQDDLTASSTSFPPEAPSKTAFSNQIPLEAHNGPGKPLRKPAGSIVALIFEGFLCLVALCFIGTLLLP